MRNAAFRSPAASPEHTLHPKAPYRSPTAPTAFVPPRRRSTWPATLPEHICFTVCHPHHKAKSVLTKRSLWRCAAILWRKWGDTAGPQRADCFLIGRSPPRIFPGNLVPFPRCRNVTRAFVWKTPAHGGQALLPQRHQRAPGPAGRTPRHPAPGAPGVPRPAGSAMSDGAPIRCICRHCFPRPAGLGRIVPRRAGDARRAGRKTRLWAQRRLRRNDDRISMVPEARFELAHPLGRRILNSGEASTHQQLAGKRSPEQEMNESGECEPALEARSRLSERTRLPPHHTCRGRHHTVSKWRSRDDVLDGTHTSYRTPTILTPAQEAVAAALRSAKSCRRFRKKHCGFSAKKTRPMETESLR